METEGGSSVTVRKTSTTPKAIIHQKFGANACYTIEEVHESADNGYPGLAIVQKGPCLYRCTLQLPEITVVSKICKKKKDAEQSAAEVALEKGEGTSGGSNTKKRVRREPAQHNVASTSQQPQQPLTQTSQNPAARGASKN